MTPFSQNVATFKEIVGLKEECLLHIETPVSCKYNNQVYSAKDMMELLEQLRKAALAAQNTNSFGTGFFGAKPANPQPQDDNKAKAGKLLQAIASQMKVEEKGCIQW